VAGTLEGDAFQRSEGRSLMIGLALYTLLGLALFLCFLVLGLRGHPKGPPDLRAVDAVTHMVGLEGLSFAHFDLLLDDSDYKRLLSLPALRGTAKQFRKDRGELASLWIGLLLNDLKNLWRFRRFLVRQGAPAGLSEEAEILCKFLASAILLHLVRLFIRFSGPFVLARTARRAKRLVEIVSYAPARVLSRIPSTGWTEIEQSWARGST